MFCTAIGLLLLGYPVAFTLAGTGAIFAFIAFFAGLFDLSFLTAFPQRILTTMSSEVLVAVPLFVFMGVMLERSKVAEELLDNMGRLFGAAKGGLAYSVCVVGALLAASTGIVGATVVTMGLLSLPTMLKRGYSKTMSCGTICASGTLGQIIPPSIVLVLLGDQLSGAFQKAQLDLGNFSPDSVSVNDLFAGALFPGLLLVGIYMIYIFFYSKIYPDNAPAIPSEELIGGSKREFYRQLARSLFAPLILIVAVLGSILGGLASPTEAASVGAVGAIMLAGHRLDEARGRPIIIGALCMFAMLAVTFFFDLRMQRDVIPDIEKVAIGVSLLLVLGLLYGIGVALVRTYQNSDSDGTRVLVSVMRSTMEISSMVFIILVGAAMFSLVFRGLEGDTYIEEILTNLPGGTFGAVLVVMAVMFIMGFFLDYLEIVFIVVPIVAPILLKMEIAPDVTMSPVWLGVLMSVNLQTSFLTPPFGFSLFYLRGVAPPGVTTWDIYKGVTPFVIIQIIALAIIWYFPALSTWLPLTLYGK